VRGKRRGTARKSYNELFAENAETHKHKIIPHMYNIVKTTARTFGITTRTFAQQCENFNRRAANAACGVGGAGTLL
jgi:hypothetical protein